MLGGSCFFLDDSAKKRALKVGLPVLDVVIGKSYKSKRKKR